MIKSLTRLRLDLAIHSLLLWFCFPHCNRYEFRKHIHAYITIMYIARFGEVHYKRLALSEFRKLEVFLLHKLSTITRSGI